MVMSNSQKMRQERRRQQEALDYAKREAEQRRQDACSHYNCEVISSYWNGLPREVVCRECGLINFLEDTEL